MIEEHTDKAYKAYKTYKTYIVSSYEGEHYVYLTEVLEKNWVATFRSEHDAHAFAGALNYMTCKESK